MLKEKISALVQKFLYPVPFFGTPCTFLVLKDSEMNFFTLEEPSSTVL